jgi:hypothetical protein
VLKVAKQYEETLKGESMEVDQEHSKNLSPMEEAKAD